MNNEIVLIICVDNSQWMMNGDYLPKNRWIAQYCAIMKYLERLYSLKIQYTVYIIAMAGKSPSIIKILSSKSSGLENNMLTITDKDPLLDDSTITNNSNSECNLIESLSTAHLIFKNKESKEYKKQLILFMGSPISNTSLLEKLNSEGLYYRKNEISLEIISFGECNFQFIRHLYLTSNSIENKCYIQHTEAGSELIVQNSNFIYSITTTGDTKTSLLSLKTNSTISSPSKIISGSNSGGGGNCRKQGSDSNRILKSKFLHYNLVFDFNNKKDPIPTSNNGDDNISDNKEDSEKSFLSVRDKLYSNIERIKALSDSIRSLNASSPTADEPLNNIEQLKESNKLNNQKAELYMEFLQNMRKLSNNSNNNNNSNSNNTSPSVSSSSPTNSLGMISPSPSSPSNRSSQPTNVMFLYRNNKIICEFQAGLCNFNSKSKKVQPLPAKGHFSLMKIGVSNFQITWRNTATMKIEKTLFFDFKEAEYRKVSINSTESRIFYFKFNYLNNTNSNNNGALEYLFLWPQYEEESKDQYYFNQINSIILSQESINSADLKKASLIKILSGFPQFQQYFNRNSSILPSPSPSPTTTTTTTTTTSNGNFTATATLNHHHHQPQKPQNNILNNIIHSNSDNSRLTSPRLRSFTKEFNALELKSKRLAADLDSLRPSPSPPTSSVTTPSQIFKTKPDEFGNNWTYSPISSSDHKIITKAKRSSSWSGIDMEINENQKIKDQLDQEEKELEFFNTHNLVEPLSLSSPLSSLSSSSTSTPIISSTTPTRIIDTIKSNSKISLFQPNPLSSIPIPLPIHQSLSANNLMLTSSHSTATNSTNNSSNSSGDISNPIPIIPNATLLSPSPSSTSSSPPSGDIEMSTSPTSSTSDIKPNDS